MKSTPKDPDARYEFRVWGERRKVLKRLLALADTDGAERFEDWYLLVDDERCNAKIRGDRLKVKRLVGQRSGFQRWSSTWVRNDRKAPDPFGDLVDHRGLIRSGTGKKKSEIASVVDEIAPERGIVPIRVTKRRRRFHLDSMKAEAATVKIDGQAGRLKTLAIEGPNLSDLVALRDTLGLNKAQNLALHLAINPAYDTPGTRN